MKFIGHECLKCVRYWVDVGKPLEPRMHTRSGNHISCVDNKYQNGHACKAHRGFWLSSYRCESPKIATHRKSGQISRQPEYEESSSMSLQACHEIDHDVEDGDGQ